MLAIFVMFGLLILLSVTTNLMNTILVEKAATAATSMRQHPVPADTTPRPLLYQPPPRAVYHMSGWFPRPADNSDCKWRCEHTDAAFCDRYEFSSEDSSCKVYEAWRQLRVTYHAVESSFEVQQSQSGTSDCESRCRQEAWCAHFTTSAITGECKLFESTWQPPLGKCERPSSPAVQSAAALSKQRGSHLSWLPSLQLGAVAGEEPARAARIFNATVLPYVVTSAVEESMKEMQENGAIHPDWRPTSATNTWSTLTHPIPGIVCTIRLQPTRPNLALRSHVPSPSASSPLADVDRNPAGYRSLAVSASTGGAGKMRSPSPAQHRTDVCGLASSHRGGRARWSSRGTLSGRALWMTRPPLWRGF